jgi:ABC-type uncharacterized transport system substrate-binding protein
MPFLWPTGQAYPPWEHDNELPVQLHVKFELVINIKAAKGLGITIPELFLLRADEVIE